MLANRLLSLGQVWYNLDRDYTCAGSVSCEAGQNTQLNRAPPPEGSMSAIHEILCRGNVSRSLYIHKKEGAEMTEQMNRIKELVVKDYFTPNIKAEVVLDTLLTPYVAKIIENQRERVFGRDGDFDGELVFITKEMSVRESEESKNGPEYGNRGIKIDYVLGDKKTIYLVELKTTGSGIDSEQAKRYLDNCRGEDGKTKTFGTVFGNKLLSVMKEAFGDTYKNSFPEPSKYDKSGKPVWDNDEALWKAFSLVFKGPRLGKQHLGEKYSMDEPSGQDAQAAMELIRKAGWSQSRKYLYTAGQILDYLYKYPEQKGFLWDKPLRLIYLTPKGESPIPFDKGKFDKRATEKDWSNFYRRNRI